MRNRVGKGEEGRMPLESMGRKKKNSASSCDLKTSMVLVKAFGCLAGDHREGSSTGSCTKQGFDSRPRRTESNSPGAVKASLFSEWSPERRTSSIPTNESKPPGNSQPRLRGFGQEGINPRSFKYQVNLLNLGSILSSKYQ